MENSAAQARRKGGLGDHANDIMCTCYRYCAGGTWRHRTTYNSPAHVREREYDQQEPDWWIADHRRSPSPLDDAREAQRMAVDGDDAYNVSAPFFATRICLLTRRTQPELFRARSEPLGPFAEHLADENEDLKPDPGCLADLARAERDALEREPSPPVSPVMRPDSPDLLEPEQEDADFGAGANHEQAEAPFSFEDLPEPVLPKLQIAMAYINLLRGATNADLPGDVLARVYAPLQEVFNLDDANHRQSIQIFLACDSRQGYIDMCASVQERNPEYELLSWAQVETKLAAWTGIHLQRHDMCVKSCIGFTGPYKDLNNCPTCAQPRRDESGRTRKEFFTFPVVTQLQARYASPARARAMRYGVRALQANLDRVRANNDEPCGPYADVFSGTNFIAARDEGRIKDDDIMLFFSTDGAQVYKNKDSNCWFSIAVILNLAPDTRYKKSEILPLCIIPGIEHEPKDMDSFNFPVFQEISALMRDGFRVWDSDRREMLQPGLHVCIAGADGPGLTTLDGGVGHKGARSCRLHCPYVGRHKEGQSRYYPALLRPHNYHVNGCCHDDEASEIIAAYEPNDRAYLCDLAEVLAAQTKAQYENARRRTGIVRPSIFLGLPAENIMGILGTISIDIMHLVALNAPEELIPLWRGLFDHDKKDHQAKRGSEWPWAVFLSDQDTWAQHGSRIGRATPYLPGWYDRVPRDPALKINSGYKAWEYMIYVYGLGPMEFRSCLPYEYWQHFCKLVRVVDLSNQDVITVDDLQELDTLARSFCVEFEELYVKRDAARLHFVRPWMHTLLHIVNQIALKGPPAYYSQWTMERVIGFLEADLGLHSNPYANLAMIAKRNAQLNALRAMVPNIKAEKPTIYDTGVDLGDGYASAQPRDGLRRPVTLVEAEALDALMDVNDLQADHTWIGNRSVLRFGRLALPNGSIARTAWKETLKRIEHLRTARMVEV
jgi:hypothetical protein